VVANQKAIIVMKTIALTFSEQVEGQANAKGPQKGYSKKDLESAKASF
jgi:hypothetical protein